MRETTRRSPETFFVDIHEVPEEEEEDDEHHEVNNSTKQPDRVEKRLKVRESKRSFSRQVSLETGFSVLNGESKKKMERGALPRSGKSFGGFGSALGTGAETRKGDFDIFRTKSALSRQSSKLPFRKESGVLDLQQNEFSGALDNELVNKSVPAGRYFAALTGPELDQVKVYMELSYLDFILIEFLFANASYRL